MKNNSLCITPGLTGGSLAGNYLFAEVAARINEYKKSGPSRVIDLSIGDVTLPLPRPAAAALATASVEMGTNAGFRGYPPCAGYDFLREAIASGHYARLGVRINADEIFISDGAKTDLGVLPQIFGRCCVYLPDPTYPAYRDVNIAVGNTVRYITANSENGFLPLPDSDCGTGIYYICSPSNPTGAAYTEEELGIWVRHVLSTGSVMIYDAAYSMFIPDADRVHPRTVYAVPEARKCAIEVNSFSKSAGFTGLRCGFTVIPAELTVDGTALSGVWQRYRAMTSNGVAYPVQRAAAATLTPDGRRACRAAIGYYLENVTILRRALRSCGITTEAGGMSPYVWFRCPGGDSWDFFTRLLESTGIAGTPGAGFGSAGEGYFRFSAFCRHEDAAEAAERLRNRLTDCGVS